MKRALDIVVSLLALALLAPFLLLISAAVFLDSGSPVIFSQERVGLHFRTFRMFKFRTMYVHSGGTLITVSGDNRITKIGKYLRLAKLDELPQFWNVLRGDMSLVGPRPEVPHYVEMFRTRYTSILNVRPGITDLASIEFRNEEELLRNCQDPLTAYVEKVLPAKLDLADQYVKTQSVARDCLILFRTAMKLI